MNRRGNVRSMVYSIDKLYFTHMETRLVQYGRYKHESHVDTRLLACKQINIQMYKRINK